MASDDEYSIPGFFLPHIEDYVFEAGGDTAALYAAASLDAVRFSATEDRLSEDQLYALVLTAMEQCNEPALGFELGSRFSVSSFGLLSRALMSCATLYEVALILERYSSLIMPPLRFSSFEKGQLLAVEIAVLSRYPLLAQTIMEALLACWDKMIGFLVGRPLSIEKVTCTYEQPQPVSYRERYAALDCGEIVFAAESNLLLLQRDYATLPLTTANAIDARTTREACERELAQQMRGRTLPAQVRDLLRFNLDSSPTSTEVAARLNYSERTFRRKLAEEGTSFREILRAVRCDMAIFYLDQSRAQVATIAAKLGYQETSNFRAAFKEWTGVSPRAWRQGKRR